MLIREIEQPDDTDLVHVAQLLATTFADPNTTLDLDRLREFLAGNRPAAHRRFHVLVVKETPAAVPIGATIFSYVAATNCGFSEYIVVDQQARGAGIGRRLFDRRREVLDRDAMQEHTARCRGLFIEADHPDRTPADLLAAEQETALDARQRWRIFDHFGFRRVDLPYVQPPLAEGKSPVDYLELMFLPWDDAARASASIPRAWVLDTLQPIWKSWAPQTYLTHYTALQLRVPDGDVALEPLFSRP